MPQFLETLDGTATTPRPAQLAYLTHLQSTWAATRIHALNAPPGTGKSYIARTIQRACPKTAIITTNNQLVDQYCATYAPLVAIKGRDFYATPEEYREAREQATFRPAVFNPLSFYYYYLANPDLARPTTIVIDEAHKLGDMLLLLVDQAFSCSYYSIPEGLNDRTLITWLSTIVTRLEAVTGTSKAPRHRSYERLRILLDYLQSNVNLVSVKYEMMALKEGARRTMHLVVRPIVMPTALLDMIFGPKTKIVLMSGSMTTFHIEELFPGAEYDFVDMPSPAGEHQRPVFYQAIPRRLRKDPPTLATAIMAIHEAEGRPNTLVHVSYSMAETLKPLLVHTNVITHTKDNKAAQLARFKAKGGIFLASGMAEGIDLPDDYCRLIIIPTLLFPNKGDDAVQKRLALESGQDWYSITTALTTIQQVGRGVRSQQDYCKTYILDFYFKSLMASTVKYISQDFRSAIHWYDEEDEG